MNVLSSFGFKLISGTQAHQHIKESAAVYLDGFRVACEWRCNHQYSFGRYRAPTRTDYRAKRGLAPMAQSPTACGAINIPPEPERFWRFFCYLTRSSVTVSLSLRQG